MNVSAQVERILTVGSQQYSLQASRAGSESEADT